MTDKLQFTRRQALAATASSVGLLATTVAPAARAAEPAPAPQQGAGFYRHKIGTKDVTVISDGALYFPDAFFAQEADAQALEANAKRFSFTGDTRAVQVNALVVRDGDDITLIDAGTAKGTYDTVGFFLDNLKNAGIDATAVNRIALTHLHFDHVGFLFDAEGKPYFPNAEIVLSEAEYAYWNADSPDLSHVGADQGTKDFFVKAAKSAIANMKGRYTLKNDGQEIAPGLQMLAAPGHTPGHFAVVMEGFAYLADTFVHPWIHLPHPEWSSRADSDPAAGVASRKRILDMVSADGLLVSGSHANFPSLGRIEKIGSGYGWQAIPFEWA